MLLFSYGSGLASSLFSIKVPTSSHAKQQLAHMASVTNLQQRLQARKAQEPSLFHTTMDVRAALHKKGAFEPAAPLHEDYLDKGTFYLTKKDDKGRRFYAQYS